MLPLIPLAAATLSLAVTFPEGFDPSGTWSFAPPENEKRTVVVDYSAGDPLQKQGTIPDENRLIQPIRLTLENETLTLQGGAPAFPITDPRDLAFANPTTAVTQPFVLQSEEMDPGCTQIDHRFERVEFPANDDFKSTRTFVDETVFKIDTPGACDEYLSYLRRTLESEKAGIYWKEVASSGALDLSRITQVKSMRIEARTDGRRTSR